MYTDNIPVVNGTTSSNTGAGVKNVPVPANSKVVMANIVQYSQLVRVIDNRADTTFLSGALQRVQQTIPLGLVNNSTAYDEPVTSSEIKDLSGDKVTCVVSRLMHMKMTAVPAVDNKPKIGGRFGGQKYIP